MFSVVLLEIDKRQVIAPFAIHSLDSKDFIHLEKIEDIFTYEILIYKFN